MAYAKEHIKDQFGTLQTGPFCLCQCIELGRLLTTYWGSPLICDHKCH